MLIEERLFSSIYNVLLYFMTFKDIVERVLAEVCNLHLKGTFIYTYFIHVISCTLHGGHVSCNPCAKLS